MHSLPPELHLRIFDLATHVPHLLDTFPDERDAFTPEYESLDILIQNFKKSLLTRIALTLVSRTFNELSTHLLYACLPLTPSSIPRILSTIQSPKSYLVQHIILDYALLKSPQEHPDRALVNLFALLPNVRSLSIRVKAPFAALFSYSLAHMMFKSLGPTLRKLALHGSAVTLFSPADLKLFMTSLVHLEAFVFPDIAAHNVLRFHPEGIPVPAYLPRLVYLSINSAAFAPFPVVTPTYVHCPLNDQLPTFLSSSLTHLSLIVSKPGSTSYGEYASISSVAPNLASLSLSGILPYLTSLLTDYSLPAVSRLVFSHLPQREEVLTHSFWVTWSYKPWTVDKWQAWVDALVLRSRSSPNASVSMVEVWDGALEKALGEMQLDVRELARCEFEVRDRNGHALVPVNRD